MPGKVLQFGRFELDRDNFELRRDGKAIKIEKSPLELLLVLAERSGKLVTQEEATELVWGKDVHIEAGSALYTAVRKIRHALGDSARKPRYIETVARKGYRFLGKRKESVPTSSHREESQRPMLAVLPLENLSRDEEQEYFSDGVTEEIITELGRLSTRELGVFARTSVMRYKRTRKSIRVIGRELGANYVIEGSVRRDAGRVRIAVQLIRVDDQTHLWAEVFDRPGREVLRIQTEVAQAVAQAIRVRLVNAARPTQEVDPEAYDLYLRGRFFQAKTIEPAMRKAIEYFQQVLQRQQEFALAWVGLAECYVRLPITSDVRPCEAFPHAEKAAERAIAADPHLAEGYAARSAVRFWHAWDWEGAERDTREALARNPSSAMAHLWRAHLLSNLGRHEEALAAVACAKQLDPFSRIINTLHGQFHYHVGPQRYQEAEALLRFALQVDPHFWVAHIHLSKIWGMSGKYKAAVQAAQKAYRYSHGNTESTAVEGWSLAMSGRRSEAREKLKALKLLCKKKFVPPLHRALILVGAGDYRGALDELEEAMAERDVRLTFLLVEPRWNPLREETRFQKIMSRLNLPPT
ncbi:MAG TPA: tetratricopeptide repeat protein [Candidatus Acidoferrum sp.]|nr:tetratricopeptide repeat protein [Candidatus Acidoferrum sp.]